MSLLISRLRLTLNDLNDFAKETLSSKELKSMEKDAIKRNSFFKRNKVSYSAIVHK